MATVEHTCSSAAWNYASSLRSTNRAPAAKAEESSVASMLLAAPVVACRKPKYSIWSSTPGDCKVFGGLSIICRLLQSLTFPVCDAKPGGRHTFSAYGNGLCPCCLLCCSPLCYSFLAALPRLPLFDTGLQVAATEALVDFHISVMQSHSQRQAATELFLGNV